MKLYATTTSERASKGQGGNNFVDVEIVDINKDRIAYIHTIPDGTNTRLSINIPYANKGNGYLKVFYISKQEQKGKSQKGEKCMFCEQGNCLQHN